MEIEFKTKVLIVPCAIRHFQGKATQQTLNVLPSHAVLTSITLSSAQQGMYSNVQSPGIPAPSRATVLEQSAVKTGNGMGTQKTLKLGLFSSYEKDRTILMVHQQDGLVCQLTSILIFKL